jgi:hypothetical protein
VNDGFGRGWTESRAGRVAHQGAAVDLQDVVFDQGCPGIRPALPSATTREGPVPMIGGKRPGQPRSATWNAGFDWGIAGLATSGEELRRLACGPCMVRASRQTPFSPAEELQLDRAVGIPSSVSNWDRPVPAIVVGNGDTIRPGIKVLATCYRGAAARDAAQICCWRRRRRVVGVGPVPAVSHRSSSPRVVAGSQGWALRTGAPA